MPNFHLHFRRGRWWSCAESTAQKLLEFILSPCCLPWTNPRTWWLCTNQTAGITAKLPLALPGKKLHESQPRQGHAHAWHSAAMPALQPSTTDRWHSSGNQLEKYHVVAGTHDWRKKNNQTKLFHWFHIAHNNSRSHTREKHLPLSFAGSNTGMACCLS